MKDILQVLLVSMILMTNIFAQGHWSKKFGQVGTNNNVPAALAVDQNGTLYIGGGFDYAFGVKTSFFAKWNPQTGWDSIPGTFYGNSFPVNSIAVDANNHVYVAGGFNGVGTLAKTGIVKWNGTKWDSIPGTYTMGFGSSPTKITFANGILYVIGAFSKAGTMNAKGIARWNGTQWDSMGSLRYTNSNNSVKNKAFTVTSDGRIYAATYSIDQFSKEDVAIIKWNGTTWDTVAKGLTGTAVSGSGTSVNAHVNDIAVNGDTIYVVGAFSTAGNKSASCIAKWNGTSWDSMGIGTFMELNDVEIDSLGRVYAAGKAAPSNGNSGWGAITRWNGKTWEKLGTGITQPQYFNGPGLRDMKIVNSKLYVCGDFTKPGAIASSGVVTWDIASSKWVALLGKNTNGLDGAALAYHETSNGQVYIGGDFNFAGAAYARRLAKWNGKTWDSVGTGSYNNGSTVKALGSDDSVLYIGGGFVNFNGVNSVGVIKWNGQKFVTMNTVGQPGTFSSDVRAITRYGNVMIVAGSFQSYFGSFPNGQVNSIIKWNGTKWDSLDVGIRNGTAAGIVNAVTVKNTDLYVAGSFTNAGQIAASSIAKWNGSAWSALNGDIIRYNKTASQASITAMTFVGTDLYIAGKFDSIGTKPMWHLAKWNGSQWDSVSLGLKNDVNGIADMAVDKNGRLYIVGKFSSIGGDNTKKYVARWNGSQWENLGSLTSNFNSDMFFAEADPKGNIFVSGYFTTVDGYNSQYLAAWINDPGIIESVKRIGDVATPLGFSIEQNFPNPFNPSTTIRFGLQISGFTSLHVFDILGKEVATLVNEELAEGTYQMTFNAANLSSGVYFYRLKSGSSMQTKRMILMK